MRNRYNLEGARHAESTDVASHRGKLHVQVVQSWTHDVAPIRDALRRAGLQVALTRVDIEPALHAAVISKPYALVIYDPATTAMSQAVLERCLRSCQRDIPVVVADDLRSLGRLAKAALRARSS